MCVRSALGRLRWLCCQFELITCSYLMEPWEKALFYGFNAALLALLLYSASACLASRASSARALLATWLGPGPGSPGEGQD